MKKSLSFRQKITALIALPMTAFFVLVAIDMKKQADVLIDISYTDDNIVFLWEVSELIHTSQKERYLSSAYLNGAVTKAELDEQIKKVDEELVQAKAKMANAHLAKDISDSLNQTFAKYAPLRNEVADKKVTPPEAIARYSEMLNTMTGFYNPIVATSNVGRIRQRVRSAAAIELANESTGQLRVKVTSILKNNTSITPAELLSLMEIYSRIETNLNSPAMVLAPEVVEMGKKFHDSKSWTSVNQTLVSVFANAKTGVYNQDPKAFFDNATQSMSDIQEMAKAEFDEAVKIGHEEMAAARADMTFNAIVLILFSIGLITLSGWVIRAISNSLESIMNRLSKGSNEVASAALQIASSSTELSEAVTEQSAAIQETVASVDEIHAMVEKNRDAANQSKKTSAESTRASQAGKESVDKMIQAIGEISAANSDMARQMEEGNKEIEEIVKVISEIGNKTKVINDIVFQTKLLSFNASVEAARAGEHGKGFAVVAEEVGNLAQMSGNAAKEISEMLDGGIKKVEQIVNTTRSRLTHLATSSKDRVEQGRAVAGQCGQALDGILSNVSSLDALVSEISVASGEQAQGVGEVTKAMSQLDQVTQQNAIVAQQSATAGESLSNQSTTLNAIVTELEHMITGGAPRKASSAQAKPAQTERAAKTAIPVPQVKKEESKKNHAPVVHIHDRAPSPQKPLKAPAHDKPMKAVAGGIPSENDPRFEDI